MDITTAEQIILIILASALAIMVLIAIIIGILLILLLDQIKRVATRAEQLADNVEHTAALFSKAAGPLAIFRVLSNVTEFVHKKSKK